MRKEIIRKYLNDFLKKAKWSNDDEKINTLLKMRSKLGELLDE